MTRPIKFRGRRLNDNSWVYGSLIVWPELHCCILESDSWNERDKIYVDHKTVGQFTGLLDKNGKEIWEGDIIRYVMYDDDGSLYSRVGDVQYMSNAQFYISGLYDNRFWPNQDSLEILGNQYENPELLK